uniref:Vomeronasal type-1 receptor n=1 Tax=Spermophilus dauricus TaxID=99837 RepID=A0A8C9PKN6_SPEDA
MVLNLVKGTTFMFLRGLGLAGNTFVLVSYIYIFRGSEKKPIHLILIHLFFANILMLFSEGTPRTIASCKVVVSLERVARGLSICTTSLLTVVQAITISPRASRWGRLQPRSAWHLLPLLLFCWMLNSLIISKRYNYCYFVPKNLIIRWIFLAFTVLGDAVFQGAMGGASGHMVFLLHKHHQHHVLHLQTSKLLYRTPPEVRAAQSILLLVLCFLFFYWTDYFMSLYSTVSLENYSMALDVQNFLTLGFAILSPFVLIHRDRHVATCFHAH